MPETSPVEPPADDQVREVARAQRRLLLGILASIFANIAVSSISSPSTPVVGVIAGAVLALVVAAYDIYWLFRLCRALEIFPWVYAAGTLLPVMGLLILAVVNQKATAFLKSRGVKVGLLGAKV